MSTTAFVNRTKNPLLDRIGKAIADEEPAAAASAMGTVICALLLAATKGDRQGALIGLEVVYEGMAQLIKDSAIVVHDEESLQ